MRKIIFPLLLAVVLFSSHDMYLKLDGYFLEANAPATIQLFNGTFAQSENSITRDRMLDVSLVGNGKRTRVDTTQWTDEDNATVLRFTTGEPGTWVAGVSTRSRELAQTAEAFNRYLEHDGVLDLLQWRKENDALEEDVVERYSKHVKTIFQVGDAITDDWQTELGYPIEFVPLRNPYALHAGEEMEVQLLWQGSPLANQLVYLDAEAAEHAHDHAAGGDHDHGTEAGHSHDHAAGGDHDHGTEAGHSHDHAAGGDHDHDDHSVAHSHDQDGAADHQHTTAATAAGEASHTHDATQLRTDAEGKVRFKLASEGTWYLQTIHLVPSPEAGITHESNWATLTFGVGHGHAHEDGAHNHDHEGDHAEGIPAYVYWLGSLLAVVGLFFWFNRKQ